MNITLIGKVFLFLCIAFSLRREGEAAVCDHNAPVAVGDLFKARRSRGATFISGTRSIWGMGGGGVPRLAATDEHPSLWCLGADSNHRHADFQSAALPTELPRPKNARPARLGGVSIGKPPNLVQNTVGGTAGASVRSQANPSSSAVGALSSSSSWAAGMA